MRLFFLLTIASTFGGIILAWVWLNAKERPSFIFDLVNRYWHRFLMGGAAFSLVVVGFEGGYVL